jgi:hydrogenase maturation factor HypF (carbamoyltransferase family)
MHMNVHEYLHDFIQFYFKLFDVFRTYTNMDLFENMHTAALLHTAAMPHTTAAHYRAHCQTAAHTLPQALPYTAVCTAAHIRALLHTSGRETYQF